MSRDLVDHCLELLAPLGAVRARRMFGGHGLYCDDLFFALIAYERLYLKVDAQTQPAFVAAGCEPFMYRSPPRPPLRGARPSEGEQGSLGRPGATLAAKTKAVSMGYWSVPAEAMESPSLMLPWARQALAAALRARAAKASSASAAPRKARALRAQAQASTSRRKR